MVSSGVSEMPIGSKQVTSIMEVNQDFSSATRIADAYGNVVVFENSHPKYKTTNLEVEPDLELTDDEKIEIIAARIMKRFKPAFLELAK